MTEKDDKNIDQISTGLKTIDQFIKISKDVAALPSLVMADSKGCAIDLADICKKILSGNENVVRWFHKFLYFDFTQSNADQQFIQLKTEYEELKTGPKYQELKFDCHEIQNIYHKRISSKLGQWFQRKKLEKAKTVFNELTQADGSMVQFVFQTVFLELDNFANDAETYFIDKNDVEKAENLRLAFKVQNKKLIKELQSFSDKLSELILEFSEKART